MLLSGLTFLPTDRWTDQQKTKQKKQLHAPESSIKGYKKGGNINNDGRKGPKV